MSETASPVILEEDSVTYGGMLLRYALLIRTAPSGRSFYIRVSKGEGEERAEAFAGTDLSRALACYRKIVSGTVTPCTLEEVLPELFYA